MGARKRTRGFRRRRGVVTGLSAISKAVSRSLLAAALGVVWLGPCLGGVVAQVPRSASAGGRSSAWCKA